MTGDKTIPAVLLALFLTIAIPTGLYFLKLPAPVLTVSEVEITKFTSQPVDMSLPPPPVAYSGLICPIVQLQAKSASDIGEKPVGTPPALPVTAARARPAPIPGLKPQRSSGSLPVVSMISYEATAKTAIVDNRVVTEGSELDGGTIVKIEENRVLMRKAGKNIWLTIE